MKHTVHCLGFTKKKRTKENESLFADCALLVCSVSLLPCLGLDVLQNSKARWIYFIKRKHHAFIKSLFSLPLLLACHPFQFTVCTLPTIRRQCSPQYLLFSLCVLPNSMNHMTRPLYAARNELQIVDSSEISSFHLYKYVVVCVLRVRASASACTRACVRVLCALIKCLHSLVGSL